MPATSLLFRRMTIVYVVAACVGYFGLGNSACTCAAEPATGTSAASIRLEHCLVSLLDDVAIPAERSGVLRKLAVREGGYVEQGVLLAEIDREQAVAIAEAAQADAAAAKAKADSRLEIEHAQVEHDVRQTEHRMSIEANQKSPNTVSLIELERLRLAAEQARLKTLVAEQERRLRTTEAASFAAKSRQADIDVRAREVRAPTSGEVVEIFFRPGEWVEPGKPLLRIVRLDRLRVEGFVSFEAVEPLSVRGRPVAVHVRFAGGREERFEGRVTFVSPLVQPGGEYRVWAEIDNRRVAEEWLLRPGVTAELLILPATDAGGTAPLAVDRTTEAVRD